MSRRKQAKPQHIHSEDPESVKNGFLQDDQLENDWSKMKRSRTETYVCEKCCAEFFDESEFVRHQNGCGEGRRVLIVKDNDEGALSELSQGSADSCPSDQSDSLSGGDTQSGGAWASEKTNGEDPLKRLQNEVFAASAMARIPNAEAEDPRGAPGAVVQQFPGVKLPPIPAGLNAIPAILEQLLSLQHQQLMQIQLTEQIRVQVAMMVSDGLSSLAGIGGAAVDPLKALGAHLSQQLSAAAAMIGKKAGAQSLSLESLKHRKDLQALSNSVPTGSDPTDLAPKISSLFPLMPGAFGFHSHFPANPAGAEPSKKGKSTPLNAGLDPKTDPGEPNLRRKCMYCGKKFGNDSGLQIHLRSHTGERPYKCNICGNRFTTRGNLKVHFQRHRDKYPHVRMNPHPVPEHLDNAASNSSVPYGIPAPTEDSGFGGGRPMPGFLPSSGRLAPMTPQNFSEGMAFSQMLPSFKSEGVFAMSGGHPRADQIFAPLAGLDGLRRPGGGGLSGEQGSGTSKLQEMVDGLEKTGSNNKCTICHRVLSCASSLKMHYRTHTGERPHKCKTCGRAFSTKGNLKAHQAVHWANAPLRTQHSCPICQKKFTNAVVLQQHIRMHMGGQIPNTPPSDAAPFGDPLAAGPSPPREKPTGGANGFDDEGSEDDDLGFQKGPGGPREPPCPPPAPKEEESSSPSSDAVALDSRMKSFASALNLQLKASVASEVGGTLNELPSTREDFPSHNDPSPAAYDSASFQSLSPVPSVFKTTSPSNAAFGGYGRGAPAWSGTMWDSDTSGALDLTSASFFPKAIKEEPGMSFSNGPPNLARLEMHVPQGNPFGADGLFCAPTLGAPTLGAGTPLGLSAAAPRRPAKQHTCATCCKTFSSSSSLQIHARTHTGEKPFACTFCNKAFTTKGNLKVHIATHLGNTSARQGRRLSLDASYVQLPAGAEFNPASEMATPPSPQGPPLVGVDLSMQSQSMQSQFSAVYANGLAMKTNEISVIQGGGVPLLKGPPGSPPEGSLEGSQSGLPASATKMDTVVSDGMPHFPQFMEERALVAGELI